MRGLNSLLNESVLQLLTREREAASDWDLSFGHHFSEHCTDGYSNSRICAIVLLLSLFKCCNKTRIFISCFNPAQGDDCLGNPGGFSLPCGQHVKPMFMKVLGCIMIKDSNGK